jgi:hypothetical protein
MDSRHSNPFVDPPQAADERPRTADTIYNPSDKLEVPIAPNANANSELVPQKGVYQRRGGSQATAVEPNSSSEDEAPKESPQKLSIKQRLKHTTWAWFTLVMATGGVASVLHSGMRSGAV